MGPIGTYNSVQKTLFAFKNHRCGRGPIETGISDAKHAVVHAQNERSCLGPIESC